MSLGWDELSNSLSSGCPEMSLTFPGVHNNPNKWVKKAQGCLEWR